MAPSSRNSATLQISLDALLAPKCAEDISSGRSSTDISSAVSTQDGAPSSNLAAHSASSSSGRTDIVVRRTFIDFADPGDEFQLGARRRTRSGGDVPSPDSTPVVSAVVAARFGTPRSGDASSRTGQTSELGFAIVPQDSQTTECSSTRSTVKQEPASSPVAMTTDAAIQTADMTSQVGPDSESPCPAATRDPQLHQAPQTQAAESRSVSASVGSDANAPPAPMRRQSMPLLTLVPPKTNWNSSLWSDDTEEWEAEASLAHSGGAANDSHVDVEETGKVTSAPVQHGGSSSRRQARKIKNQHMRHGGASPHSSASQASQEEQQILNMDSLRSVEEVLRMFDSRSNIITVAEGIAAIHLAAKLFDADAMGPLPYARMAGATGGNGSSPLPQDGRFVQLVGFLARNVAQFSGPRSYMQTIWALGKLGSWNSNVHTIMEHLLTVSQQLLPLFSAHELSNTIWGIAWLCSSMEGGQRARQCRSGINLAHAVVAESLGRVRRFEGQVLSNSLWAIAKLDLRTEQVSAFAAACVDTMQQSGFGSMLPQGIANSLWAAAKLQLNREIAGPLCIRVAEYVNSDISTLAKFQSQELSMAIWAFAKVLGGRGGARNGRGAAPHPTSVRLFAVGVAQEALIRIEDLSPQGLSNVAWALATLDLVKLESCRTFLLAVARQSASDMKRFPPQAIANICWALARLERPVSDHAANFYKAAAREAADRTNEFSWQDLSGIISAMMQGGVSHLPEVHWFASALVQNAAGNCQSIGTQALLNIALAATRLGVSEEVLKPMAFGISEAFALRAQQLNDIDLRQWNTVMRYCKIQGCSQVGSRGQQGGGYPGNRDGISAKRPLNRRQLQ